MTPSPRPRRRAAPRGFSLIEAIVVIGIVGILSIFAVTGFIHGTRRAKANNATYEIQTLFSIGQLRATSTARPHYLVVWLNSAGNYGVQLLDYTPGTTPPAWSTMTPGAPSSSFVRVDQVRLSTDRIAERVTLSDLQTARVAIPSLKLLSAYPAPYQAVRMIGSGGATNLAKACSFCTDQGGGSLGVVRFNINGTLDVLTGPSTAGGSLGIEIARTDTSTAADPRILAFTAPLATVRVYQ